MKKILTLFCLFVAFQSFSQQNILFDDGWKFHRGDTTNAEQINFDDNNWRQVDLPHDFSIEDLPGTNSPFNPDVINGVSIGFTTGGIGWYRKTFTLPSVQKNKKIILLFDGVYMNADVWLNGKHLGNHPYGYTSFYYDISDKIKWNEKNIIAVQVKNVGATSRWYAGSGINRHVWLKIKEPVHVSEWSQYITTPKINVTSANVNIATQVLNKTDKLSTVTLISKIINAQEKEVTSISSKHEISTEGSFVFDQNLIVKSPALWSTENPSLYKVVSDVYVGGKLSDHIETKFGIRKISFSASTGFMLNDKPMKLKGACFHIDNGPLGARSYNAAEIRRVALLKASGFNAIRCSHNPPPTSFLDACDSLGMMVIDEAFDMWNEGKNDNDYHLYFVNSWKHDLQCMVIRDRSHPCIIMWSIGN
ncbi:MAG TPA: glycoside hydrolase family 2 TIM barrel-domain containing protein, partial [Parafilimonas sp.]